MLSFTPHSNPLAVSFHPRVASLQYPFPVSLQLAAHIVKRVLPDLWLIYPFFPLQLFSTLGFMP